MKCWLIWMQDPVDGHTWLEAAWDDDMVSACWVNWDKEIERCRRFAASDGYEMRIQIVTVPQVDKLFKIPEVSDVG